jgi:hypothetical protein
LRTKEKLRRRDPLSKIVLSSSDAASRPAVDTRPASFGMAEMKPSVSSEVKQAVTELPSR